MAFSLAFAMQLSIKVSLLWLRHHTKKMVILQSSIEKDLAFSVFIQTSSLPLVHNFVKTHTSFCSTLVVNVYVCFLADLVVWGVQGGNGAKTWGYWAVVTPKCPLSPL